MEYNYFNENIEIPEWLSDPESFSANQDEETSIYIEETIIATINGYTLVKVSLDIDVHNSGGSSIYLASFNKNMELTDLIFVHSYMENDWIASSEISFDEINNQQLHFFHVLQHYERADTTSLYFEISKDGQILEGYEDFNPR